MTTITVSREAMELALWHVTSSNVSKRAKSYKISRALLHVIEQLQISGQLEMTPTCKERE